MELSSIDDNIASDIQVDFEPTSQPSSKTSDLALVDASNARVRNLDALQKMKAEVELARATNPEQSALIEILVKYGNSPDGIPALLYAAKLGDLEAVQLLIKYGADPFTADSHGITALPYALLYRS